MNSYKDNAYLRSKLDNIIDNRIKALEKYSRLDNASQARLDIENKLLADLHYIYNSLYIFQYGELWIDIEESIKVLEELDDNLSGHLILIRKKPYGDHFSSISKFAFNFIDERI